MLPPPSLISPRNLDDAHVPIAGKLLWNPYEVLDIRLDFTCIGIVMSKGNKRCQYKTSQKRRLWVNRTLNELRTRAPTLDWNDMSLLRSVAGALLCLHHRSQIDAIVEDWIRRVQEFLKKYEERLSVIASATELDNKLEESLLEDTNDKSPQVVHSSVTRIDSLALAGPKEEKGGLDGDSRTKILSPSSDVTESRADYLRSLKLAFEARSEVSGSLSPMKQRFSSFKLLDTLKSEFNRIGFNLLTDGNPDEIILELQERHLYMDDNGRTFKLTPGPLIPVPEF